MDVLPSTWAPDPAVITRLARQNDVGAILIVAPFGAPLDLALWDEVQRRAGIPLIVDAAAAFDALRVGGPMPAGHCPVVVSLHATKSFGIGEGGALLSRDADLLGRVRALAQFGFAGTRLSQSRGVNAKISEYAAAVGLAGFDLWDETRARWEYVSQSYRARLPASVTLTPSFGRDWVASTLTALWPDDRPNLSDLFADQGIATLSWWGAGCHAQPAYADCPAEKLPVTELYARRAVGLPFWQDLTEDQIDTVCAAVTRMLGTVVRKRGRTRGLVPA